MARFLAVTPYRIYIYPADGSLDKRGEKMGASVSRGMAARRPHGARPSVGISVVARVRRTRQQVVGWFAVTGCLLESTELA